MSKLMTQYEKDEYAKVVKLIEDLGVRIYAGETDKHFDEIFELLSEDQKKIYLKGTRDTCHYLSAGICPTTGCSPQKEQRLQFMPTGSHRLNQELTEMYDPRVAKNNSMTKALREEDEDFEKEEKPKARKKSEKSEQDHLIELKNWGFKFFVKVTVFSMIALVFLICFWDPGDNASFLGRFVNGARVLIEAGN